MVEEEKSIFIKKYQQILKFKSQVSKKIKLYKKENNKESININVINTNNNNLSNNKKSLKILLPNIKILRKTSSSQADLKVNDQKLIKNNQKKSAVDMNQSSKNNSGDIFKEIMNTKKNGQEYKKLISKYGDAFPKKKVEVISKSLYNRLLNRFDKDENIQPNKNNDDSNKKNNLSNDKEEKKSKKILLPFLANVKSRYKNYNDEYNAFTSTKKSKSTYKTLVGDKNKEKKFYYLVLPGNNSSLVERCILTRPNWRKIKDSRLTISCNFIWTELSQEIDFPLHNETCYSQIVNHFENHYEISNKKNLFINLLKYCENNQLNLFSFYPLTIILNLNKDYFNEQMEIFKQLYEKIPSLVDGNNDEETEKIFNEYFRLHRIKRAENSQKIVIPKSYYKGKNLWLIKRINLNRGREIKVLSDFNDIINEVESIKKEKKCNRLIIQKYIEDTLLYNNRKFDIRIWVLFAYISTEDKYEVFVFKEGHLKACSENFNINSDDIYVHLTNYSVQKYNKNFSKIEIGNEISFETFQNELDKANSTKNFKKEIFPKILRLITISANASKSKINVLGRKNCFEIFGYDFILDNNFEPFLLEINTNPGLEESSPLIKMLVPRMIDDALRLTIDSFFERNDQDANISKFKVDGYTDEENMWQKINFKI